MPRWLRNDTRPTRLGLDTDIDTDIDQTEENTHVDLINRGWLVIRRRWLVIFAALAVALVAVSLLNGMQRREYTASAVLFLRAPDVKSSASAYQGDLFSKQRAQTYVSMFTSADLARLVVDRIGLNTPPSELVKHVKADVVKDTVLITVEASDTNAQQAANIANAYGAVFGDYVAKVEDVENNPNLPPLVTTVKDATVANAVRGGYPLPLLATAGAVLALGLAMVGVWFLERFDTRLRSRRQIEEVSGAPVVGALPRTGALEAQSAAETYRTSPDFAEDVRRLSINVDHLLRQIGNGKDTPALAISSAESGDGKSAVAAAIAAAMVHRDCVVGFIDAGHTTESAVGMAGLADMGFDAEKFTFVALPSNGLSFTRRELEEAIDELKATCGVVIIDGPAFADSSEAQTIAEVADAVLVVVRPGHTRVAALNGLMAAMDVLDTPVIGVVANRAKATSTVDTSYT